MSFTPPREVNVTIDENQQGEDDGGECEGGEGIFDSPPTPPPDFLQKWKKATLLVSACNRYRYTLGKGIVAGVSESVVSRYRVIVHALLAVQRFKLAGQDRKPSLDDAPPQQPTQKQCNWEFVAQWLAQTVLYKRPYPTGHTNQKYRLSDTVWSMFFVLFVSASGGTALYFRIVGWPLEFTFYTTEELPENAGGVMVSCESYLMGANDPDTNTTTNMCFRANKLETVSVVMFSEPMAKAFMGETIEEDSSKRPITKILEGGLSVTQEAYDIDELVHSTVQAPLTPLFQRGYKDDDEYLTMKNMRHVMEFPHDYVRLSWVYDCNNCSSCGLVAVRDLSRSIVSSDEASWVSCFLYGIRANKCRSRNRYTGKCKLYPPEKLPTLAFRRFLKQFRKLRGVSNIRASEEAHREQIKLEPNILFLNISHALSSSVMLSFMEVEMGSSTWMALLRSFPTVKDCTKLPRVPVCNGTSVCNMFRSADSYDLRCLDFRNNTQCKLLLQPNVHVPRYSTNKVEQTDDILCPTTFNCMEEAPHLVVWKTPGLMEDDALNSFVGSRKLYEEWAKRSGVCTNTYNNVIRYRPPIADGPAGATARENVTILLESKCTTETSTQASHCVPTGRYHTLSDDPGAEWKHIGDDLALTITARIKWKRAKRMRFGKWYIGTLGSVFGWIGSAILLFDVVFAFFYCLRPRLAAQFSKLKLKRV